MVRAFWSGYSSRNQPVVVFMYRPKRFMMISYRRRYSSFCSAARKNSRGVSRSISTGLWTLAFHASWFSCLKRIRASGCQLHQRL